jgi:NADH-quinone oxidoreductase subunit H
MMTCLKYLVPISCFLFLGAAVWPLALAAMTGGHTHWMPNRPLGNRVPRRPAAVSTAGPRTVRAESPAGPSVALEPFAALRIAHVPRKDARP